MRVTFADIRACQFCSKGARQWFREHDLNYLDFVKNGIDAEILIKTGDAFALRAVEQARTREALNHGAQ